MSLFDDADVVAGLAEFKQSNQVRFDKLRRDRPAQKLREFLCPASDVLSGLNGRKPIAAALRSNRQHVLATALVDADVDFVYLDLA